MSWDCREQKYGNYNQKSEKAEKAMEGDKNDLVLCLLMMENKKENVKKEVWFTEDLKQPSETGMMCTINGDTCFSFTKNTWIGNSGASCHIMNNDTSFYDVTDINKLIQDSYGIMSATKRQAMSQGIAHQWD